MNNMAYVEPKNKDAKALNHYTKGHLGRKLFIVVTGETFGVHETVLNLAMTTRSKVKVTDDPRGCDGVIVFCPITFQIQPDVDAGMKLIPELAKGKPVILVLMHQTEDADYEIDEPKWSENPSVMSKVHILYNETKAELLTGPKNEKAIRQLQGIFNKFGVPILPCTVS